VEFLRQLLNGIRQAWKELSLSARINLALAALAVVAVIALVVIMGAKPQYVTLSTNVEPSQLPKIVDALTAESISYQLANGNKDILVPITERSSAQLLLAEKELPVGRTVPPGFELFKETELMTNQWLQDVKFMRAVQGELQRILNAFDFVEYSYVLIREAKEELFVSEQKPSEAAVTLAIKRPLTKEEVKAIVSIVDHAGGPNLHPGNITVTTTKGDVLYMPPQSEFASLASSKLELVADWEKQRETKLMTKLREMGVRGTVSVSAKMDFDQKESTDEKISEGTELSTYSTSTTNTSTEKLPEGAPGAFANPPEGTVKPGGTTTNEETTEEITNYEPSRTVTKTKTDPGNVVKFVVAMVIEGDYKESKDDQGNTTRQYTGLTEERKQTFMDLAKATVGEGEIPTEVTILDHPFKIDELAAVTGAVEAAQGERRWDQAMHWIWVGMEVVALVIGFLFIRRLLSRAIAIPEVAEEEEASALPEATREDLRRQDVATEVGRLSEREPEVVAALLRTWIAEGHE